MIPDTFLAADRLWLLLVVPALLIAYLLRQRTRQLHAVRFSAVPLLGGLARRPGWRRHVVATGLLLSLVPLVVSFSRPAALVKVPRDRATVILAIDTSLSMQATDVPPNRLRAAQEAASRFVREMPPRFNVGVVAFSQSANVVVAPTTNRERAVRSIQALTLGPYTAIGEAIFVSIDALRAAPPDPTSPDMLPPSTIVLLSDGSTTWGRGNSMAAEAANELGIPVSTIAFGTDAGSVTIEGVTTGVPVDRDALRTIAVGTGGEFYEADSLNQLNEVYADIGSAVGFVLEPDEISARWTGLGLVLLLFTSVVSLGWFGRLP